MHEKVVVTLRNRERRHQNEKYDKAQPRRSHFAAPLAFIRRQARLVCGERNKREEGVTPTLHVNGDHLLKPLHVAGLFMLCSLARYGAWLAQ